MNTRQETGEPPLKKQKSDGSEDTSCINLNAEPVTMVTAPFTLGTIPTPVSLDMTDISGMKGKSFPKSTVVMTTGNLRPSLNIVTDGSKTQPGLNTRVTGTTTPFVHCSQYIPVQQSWTPDGKVTLQFTPGSYTTQTQRTPLTPPTLTPIQSTTNPRYPVPQVITLPNRISMATTGNSVVSKPMKVASSPVVDTKVPQTVVIQKGPPSDSNKTTEQMKLTPGQTQISFQVPLNWSTQGSKSLLDNSKTVSLVSVNPPETSTRSLLHGNEATTVQSNTSNVTVPTMTLSSATIARIAKRNSVMISNKPYTIVPSSSSSVVTQLVKTEKLNKGKVTMAEAQIMLPTGPAKISWPLGPLQTQSSTPDNKHILITTPVGSKGGQPVPGKSSISNKQVLMTSIEPSAKTSDDSVTVPSKTLSSGGTHVITQKITMPVKGNVIPAQKNWELVKQSSQLLPRNSNKSPVAAIEKQSEIKTLDVSKMQSVETNMKNGGGSIPIVEIKTEKIENEPYTEISEPSDPGKDSSTLSDTKDVKPIIGTLESRSTPENVGTEKEEQDNNGIEAMDTNEGVENKLVIKQENIDCEETDVDFKENTKNGEADIDRKDDFNPVDVMTWNNGVGQLPGSDLKFQMNDLGVLEVINDGLECNETLNTSDELDQVDTNKDTPIKEEKQDSVNDTKDTTKEEVSNKDEISQCQYCREYGFITDFYKDGKFCSQTCVRAFESKHMREVKKQGTMSKMILNMKKQKKKILLKDGVPQKEEVPNKTDVGQGKKSKAFVWTRYLEQEKAAEAPARLFKNPFPSVKQQMSKNNFRVGMKLEGIDPMRQSKFCALSVSEVCGYRIRLHFEGYSECYDFWVDMDSPFIFPVGFCEKNGKVLQPPKGFSVEEFSWTSFLKLTKATPVPKNLFSNQPVQSVTPNLFRVGSKLEAVDKKNSSLICVASVADTLGDKVLVHFDSWEDNYDYWCDMSSPFIHPIGHCDKEKLVLSPPQDWKDVSGFTWEKYLIKTKSQAVPARAFKPRAPVAFEGGMKVEVVDKRNPLLVRVATIEEVEDYLVKIHFDGWSDVYDYWLEDDSPDIHPPGWCAKTGHPLVPPITPQDLVVTTGPGVCPTPGCKGIGHIKGPKYSGHHSTFGCPYSDINMNKGSVLGDRLNSFPMRVEDINSRPDDVNNSPDSKRTTDLMHGGDTPKKMGRGRKPKSYYIALEEQKVAQEKERMEKEEELRRGIHNSVFTSSMISTPKTEVPLCWEQHCKLLPGVTNVRGNDVNKWNTDQVADFINTLPGCEEQAKLFREEQIDGEAFLLLTQSDIVKIMNIKLGPALKIFNSIVMFKNSVEV
ncbi:SAM domain binding [Mactra antiquata]